MEIEGDPHEAQWRKLSEENLKMYKDTNETHFKARHEACERLLLEYC